MVFDEVREERDHERLAAGAGEHGVMQGGIGDAADVGQIGADLVRGEVGQLERFDLAEFRHRLRRLVA